MNVKSIKAGLLFAAVVTALAAFTAAPPPLVQALGMKGPYLGQTPPGKAPELFAPDAFRGVEVHDSPRRGADQSGRITKDIFISFRLKGDAWSEAVPLGPGVNVPGVDDLCPVVSPDGKYLFFVSRRINRAFRAFWVNAGLIEDLRRSHGVVR